MTDQQQLQSTTVDKPKYLILLDMNGTICYRHEQPIEGLREDLYIRRKFIYRRLGAEKLVQELHNTGIFDICIYSSMMAHNINAVLDVVLPDGKHLLKAVLDRNYNKRDPNGVNSWDTVRDIHKVWEELPGYGPERTLLVDNETRKFQDAKANGIVVEEYGSVEVAARKSNSLEAVLHYLLELAEAAPRDVREYMKTKPFVPEVANADDNNGAVGDGDGVEQLSESLQGVSLDSIEEPSQAPLTRVRASGKGKGRGQGTKKSDADAKHNTDPSSSATAAAIASATATTTDADVASKSVPRGTDLRLLCIDHGEFVLRNNLHNVEVRGSASVPLRIELKMDFHRLLEEAKRVGVALSVRLGGGARRKHKILDTAATC